MQTWTSWCVSPKYTWPSAVHTVIFYTRLTYQEQLISLSETIHCIRLKQEHKGHNWQIAIWEKKSSLTFHVCKKNKRFKSYSILYYDYSHLLDGLLTHTQLRTCQCVRSVNMKKWRNFKYNWQIIIHWKKSTIYPLTHTWAHRHPWLAKHWVTGKKQFCLMLNNNHFNTFFFFLRGKWLLIKFIRHFVICFWNINTCFFVEPLKYLLKAWIIFSLAVLAEC